MSLGVVVGLGLLVAFVVAGLVYGLAQLPPRGRP
jgi:hypothetical protein